MKRVNAAASILGSTFVLLITILITANIIGRKLGMPLPGTIGLAGFMLAAVVFLGLSHCEEVEGHVRVEFLLFRLSPKNRVSLLIFDYFIALAVFGAMGWATGIDMLLSWKRLEIYTGAIYLPVYPVKTIVTLGCVLMVIQLILNTIKLIKQRRLESEAETVRKGFA